MVRSLQDVRAGAGRGSPRPTSGKLTVAKLDIDANPATPGKYGIRGHSDGHPVHKGGQAHAQKVGALTKSQLTAFLDSNL